VLRIAVASLLLAACVADETPPDENLGPLVQYKVMYKDLPIVDPQLRLSLPDPCLEVPLLDADPLRDGLQVDCSAVGLFETGDERILPSCEAFPNALPCWRLIADSMSCFVADRLRVDVVRAAPPGDERHIILNCVSR
jgi:hypothetical protein